MSISSNAEEIHHQPLSEALSERYLAYALSTIVSRSLPDVRDGLKPVHRRLLYAMRILKLDPAAGFKKCARVVGDVIGKYHPHGDTAVYEAMVRLAQDFAARYPLVEGQGNFGNIDGDDAAAMRYTEARLTSIAVAMMEGLDDDAVDFRDTYDGTEREPIVMPAAFPNLLANGSSGIAVGMATSIPPHNAGELCDALLYLIQHPECSVSDLLEFVKGPDFPTGGILAEDRGGLRETYTSGRGTLRLRARWKVEKLTHGLFQVIVTEIPYQIQKSRVIEKIAELLNARRLPLLADVRDESAEDVRIILEPRNRTVDPSLMMEHLFKTTDLEIRFGVNMNVLDADGIPKVMSLKDVLWAFLDHRRDVLLRRSRYRLEKIRHRLEILEGYLVAYLNLDEVIRIIREEEDPKAVLMDRFALSDIQSEAILNMRLRSLRRLEEIEIQTGRDNLMQEKDDLERIVSDNNRQWSVLSAEIRRIGKEFGQKTPLGTRRTEITSAPAMVEVSLEAVIEREPITILLSRRGWIRAVKGHSETLDDAKFKDGDELFIAVKSYTTDKILLFSSHGRMFTVMGDRVPRGRGFGEPVRLMIDLPNDADIVAMFVHEDGRDVLVASSCGRGFRISQSDLVGHTRAGKQILSLGTGETASICHQIDPEADSVAVIGQNRRMVVFDLAEIPLMSKGRGVILQSYRGGGLADLKTFKAVDGLSFSWGERTRTETDLTPWRGRRATVGRIPPVGFPRNNRFGG